MRKPQQIYNLEIPDDYKIAQVMKRDKANFESPNIWFYLGADLRNPNFAKVGITMGDLRSRSYSSANPNYYLFCAFQCDQSTDTKQLTDIENSALSYLDRVFAWDNGQTKRVRHMESQHLSECYYDINFDDFFACLHDYLLDHHERYFQSVEYDYGEALHGYALSCEFNPRLELNDRRRFLRMILRY